MIATRSPEEAMPRSRARVAQSSSSLRRLVQSSAWIELKLNVFAAGDLGDELICEARPLHVGRSTAVIEAKIRNGEKAVANLIVTQFVLPGRDPRAERPAPGDYPPGD